jgi:hypothetical protein
MRSSWLPGGSEQWSWLPAAPEQCVIEAERCTAQVGAHTRTHTQRCIILDYRVERTGPGLSGPVVIFMRILSRWAILSEARPPSFYTTSSSREERAVANFTSFPNGPDGNGDRIGPTLPKFIDAPFTYRSRSPSTPIAHRYRQLGRLVLATPAPVIENSLAWQFSGSPAINSRSSF